MPTKRRIKGRRVRKPVDRTPPLTPAEYLTLDNRPATHRMPKELAAAARRVTIYALADRAALQHALER